MNLYYSPKKGEKVPLKKDKGFQFLEHLNILGKLKPKTVEIGKDHIKAKVENVSIRVKTKLDFECVVNYKDLLNAVKKITGPFKATLLETSILFSWDGGNTVSVPIESSEISPGDGLGAELKNFESDDFYHALNVGGLAVGKGNVLGYVYFDSTCFVSTDNICASMAEYNIYNNLKFTLSEKTYNLWKTLDLPTRTISVCEKGIRFFLREDVVLIEKSPDSWYYKLAEIVKDKIKFYQEQSRLQMDSFCIPQSFWKSLSSFKNCKEITISNNKIESKEPPISIKTDLAPFLENHSLTIALDKLLSLKPAVIESSKFRMVCLHTDQVVHNYLVVVPEPGGYDTIVLGCATEEMPF